MAISDVEQSLGSTGYWEWPQGEAFMEQRQYRHHRKEDALRGIKKHCVCQGHTRLAAGTGKPRGPVENHCWKGCQE